MDKELLNNGLSELLKTAEDKDKNEPAPKSCNIDNPDCENCGS